MIQVRLLFILLILLPGMPLLHAFDLSIDDACMIAERNWEGITFKRAEVSKAQYSLGESQARRFPDISMRASGSYMLVQPEMEMKIPKGSLLPGPLPMTLPPNDTSFSIKQENTYFKLSVTLNQPLFTWGKISNAISIAEQEVSITRAAVDQSIRDLTREVSILYFSALLARESRDLLARAIVVLQTIASDRENSFNQGLINNQKVLEAKSGLAAMLSRKVQAEEASFTSLQGIAMYTGLDAAEIVLSSLFRDELPAIDESVLQRLALDNSSEREIVRHKVLQAQTYAELEKGNSLFLPDFSFITSFDVTGQKIPFSADDWATTWDWNCTFSLGMQMNLFDGLKSYNRQKAAEKSVSMAALGLEQLEKGIPLKVRKAVQELRTCYYMLQEKKAKQAEAHEQQKNARVSFDNQLATREESSGAMIIVYSADLEYLLSLYNYQRALVELNFLTGRRF